MSKKIKTQAIMSAQSRAEVVDNIAQMGALQREILRLNAELNDQITPLKQACDEKVAKLQAQINVLSESCHIWCEANRAELTDNHRVKFADLSTGVVKWRIKNPSVSISQKNGAEVIDRLLQNPNYKRFVREKLEVNRELILQYPEMFEDNQILGIKIKRGEEDFVIEPNFDEVGAKA
ncbi:host-nuclease inhibitor Gam family protein [Simonsiella muelleri]|uniref:Host-nuclease inhibitor protein Gam n=1 Tax=Simonsiella muelleri ATCC 29453 TaxID=641147 RepID=U6Q0Z7_9NEIS|nr:host-nuclease inhibitor Gam family protein [Simonsiella muelleri]AUX61886.1 hypothetical protein BWP33_08775 [Simonsiella muelleri ATCC 29453]AUX62252.1 hypothetical protein BWP33_10825 [Simonsiella muelleri ATCC 29453]EFG30155.1 hypothetical protein HMPREF9021_01924 [Simonsiella muelleri ATCC 29453]UBQ53973.1 host-nuclease inhibitor Gam family protein [Simonsiella muelleri]UBQ54351.1 host-nuclease inhibitor Gam family protein [Simonsiella muelleri]